MNSTPNSCALRLHRISVITIIKQLVQLNVGGSKYVEDEEKMAEVLGNSDLKVSNTARWPFRNKRLTRNHYQKSVKATTMLVRPKSVGTLKLKSANPFDHPLIDPNYLSHPDDEEAFIEGYVHITQLQFD